MQRRNVPAPRKQSYNTNASQAGGIQLIAPLPLLDDFTRLKLEKVHHPTPALYDRH